MASQAYLRSCQNLWHAHLRGEETSFNPLGMVEAVIGAIQHAATLDTSNQDAMMEYTYDTQGSQIKNKKLYR